ncbi:MAG: hypothetical protein GXX99_05775 [Clostridiales bacterium]|mgnify:CR=1 FL=1|nr:hypothetical protein [Clostridiales bacterium]
MSKKRPNMPPTATALLAAGLLLFCGGFATAALLLPSTAKVQVDGRDIPMEAYNIDGCNYYKLRDIAAAVDFGLWFDERENTVHIERDKRYDASYSGPDSGQPLYGRTHPAPVGVEQFVRVENTLEHYTALIRLDEVLRGERALQLLSEANSYNGAPPEGKEYVLAKFTASVESSEGDRAVSFRHDKFVLFSEGGVEYKLDSILAPDPKFRGDVYAGSGALTGYAAFLVDCSDPAPRAAFGRSYDGTGGIWFDLSGS